MHALTNVAVDGTDESRLTDGPMDVESPARLLDGVSTTLQPEKRLMLAILEGAVADYQKYATAPTGRGRRLFAEAQAWFESTAADRIVDFECVCEALGLDASCIRTGLHRWCATRRRQSIASRTVLRFPFRRVSGTRHTIAAAS